MGLKIISYSLYGNAEKYTYNAIINCIIAQELFPDWICRFYIDQTVPVEIVQTLYGFRNVQVNYLGSSSKHPVGHPIYWRLFAATDPSVDIVISRDVDSWL